MRGKPQLIKHLPNFKAYSSLKMADIKVSALFVTIQECGPLPAVQLIVSGTDSSSCFVSMLALRSFAQTWGKYCTALGICVCCNTLALFFQK